MRLAEPMSSLRARLAGTPTPEHTWDVGDVVIAGDAFGPEGGRPVFLLHGGGQTRHSWQDTGRRLGELGYRTYALDARGHGDSDWDPRGNYRDEDYIADLAAVIDAVGAACPVLVGASLGGITALGAIGSGQVSASALVMVDVAPRIEPAGVARIGLFMDANPHGFESLDDVADAIASYQPQRKRRVGTQGLAKNVRRGADGRYYWHWDPAIRREGADPDRAVRLEGYARALTIPTLLVRGKASDVLGGDGVRAFKTVCPDAEFIDVKGAGHMVAGDENDGFTGAVIDFLTRRAPVQRGTAKS